MSNQSFQKLFNPDEANELIPRLELLIRETQVALKTLRSRVAALAVNDDRLVNLTLPEIIEHGKTGFLVERETELAEAIHACGELDPAECKRTAEQLFTSSRMVESYIASYRHILECSNRKLQAA